MKILIQSSDCLWKKVGWQRSTKEETNFLEPKMYTEDTGVYTGVQACQNTLYSLDLCISVWILFNLLSKTLPT